MNIFLIGLASGLILASLLIHLLLKIYEEKKRCPVCHASIKYVKYKKKYTCKNCGRVITKYTIENE